MNFILCWRDQRQRAAVDSVDSSSPRLTLSSIADPEPSVKLLFYPELSAKVASLLLFYLSLK